MSRPAVGLALLVGGLQAVLTTIRFKGLYQRSLTVDESAIDTLQMSSQNRRLLRRFVTKPGDGRRAIAMGTVLSALTLTAGLLFLIL